MTGRRRRWTPATGLGLAATVSLLVGLVVFGKSGPAPARAHPVPLNRSDRLAGMPIGVLSPSRADRLTRLAGRQQESARVDAEARAVRHFLRFRYPVYCGGGRGHAIALTFDDGPSPQSELLATLLKRAHMQGTFFFVGRQLGAFPRGAEAIAAGNAVGDHTWSHAALPALRAVALRSEVASAQVAIRALSGLPVVLFRPPYGRRSRAVDREVASRGMVEILWTIDDRDTTGIAARAIIRRVLTRVRPGAIVLMHETRPQAAAALARILPQLKRRGLTSVSIPTLLERDPPSLDQLRAGFGGCGVRP